MTTTPTLPRGITRRCWLAAGLAWSAVPAGAQDRRFPSREVTLVVPNEPGGNMDTLARLVARGLGAQWSQPVVVTFRSGASGNVGTASVARAEPDGHTLLITGISHLVSPMLHAEPGYHPLRDFMPIARLAVAPTVLLVHESLRGQSLQQIVAGPGRSGALAYASAGYGHTSHLAAELFLGHAGLKALHVPYRGTGPATRALMAGEVQMMFVPAGSVATLLASGRVVAVAVAQPERLPLLPQTPTLAEQGFRGADFSQWYALFAPAATPGAVADEISRAVLRALDDGSARDALAALSMQPGAQGRADFARFVAAEHQRLAAVVKVEKVRGAQG